MSLTPQQELFAQKVVELVNQSAAYRAAYDVAPTTKWTTVSECASRLAAEPVVAARILQLQNEAAAKSAIPPAAVRIAELRAIEAADANDIIGIRWVNCRHCRGIDHKYQWRDDMEYAAAYDAAMTGQSKPPAMDGGFGFNGTLEPVKNCPMCWGVGEQRPFVADTTKLTGGARLLYKGAKIKGNGDIEILLHDQTKIRDMLNRIQGVYKDAQQGQGGVGQGAAPAGTTASPVTAAKTSDERQRNYLRLVSA